MICISIAQESRRFALADMLNASRQCDLLEVRLDKFDKAPDFGELLANKPKPVIMSCRRIQDGGHWDGSETERLALLRQCIIAKADYVEIELDVADQIRPFPPAKRVVAYTNLQETPSNIAEIYAQAQACTPDVIKLTTLARTPEEAWPLVQVLAKPPVPTVVVGLGKPGLMLTVLGKKIGAPWTYAALERGMEAHPDQPTVHDLRSVYHYDDIGKSTRLIGVTGFSARAYATVAVLNAAFAHLGLPARCLPLSMGSVRLFRKIVEAVKLAGVVVDEEHQHSILEFVTDLELAAQEAQAADLILHKREQWHGYNTEARATVAALESAIRVKHPSDRPLQGRMVMVVGTTPAARRLIPGIQERGGVPTIASHDKNAALQLAQALGCRHVQFEAVYSTMHDVLVVCDEEKEQSKSKSSEAGLRPGYLKPGMTVMDLTATIRKSKLIREAEERGCSVVTPRRLLLDQLDVLARLITAKDVPREVLDQALPADPDEVD